MITEVLTRFGLDVLAFVFIYFARRNHTRASGKSEKPQKWFWTVVGFLGGASALGGVAGDYMTRTAGPATYFSAAVAAFCLLGFIGDVWRDKRPDKLAFWCAICMPLALVIGFGPLTGAGKTEIGNRVQQVSNSINGGTGNVTAPGKPGNITVRK